MKWTSRAAAFWVGLSATTISLNSQAEMTACGDKATRANVVSCAVRASFSARSGTESVKAAEGRKEAAEVVLPSAPVLSVSVAARSATNTPQVVNVYTNLSQEIEIGGQRGARQKVAEADKTVEEKRKTLTEREVAAAAWKAYFEALAAAEETALSRRVEALHLATATALQLSSEKGLSAGVDSELAEATALRSTMARLTAERREKAARAALGALWTRDPSLPSLQVEGDLTPLRLALDLAQKNALKPPSNPLEAQVAEAEKQGQLARVDLLERSRIPNITLSIFVQRDGFDETVIGGGISLPIPLPHPVTRTQAGEISEASALARKAAVEAEAARTKTSTQLTLALSEFASRKAEVDTVSADKLSRAQKSIQNLATEVQNGRLALREAAPAEQALLDLLLTHLQAKRALCIASVELAQAAGIALEGGTQ
ncbi:MAG: TolC family protein [Polyangiaceae bacterium]|nr:TolC family protein [Polyangiaceae bacterium]